MSFAEETLGLPDGDVAFLRRAGTSSAATLVFAHANGLNAGAYGPMLDALQWPGTVIALDLRGHGRTRLPAEPDTLRRWNLYADDLERIVPRLTTGRAVLAGHSMGAVAALLSAGALAPERVVMIEPVIVPSAVRLVARVPALAPLLRKQGIAGRAMRRRDGWPDHAAARDQYGARAFFADWHEDALDGYLRRGLRPDVEAGGDGVVLACAPAWEAASFAAQGHRFWRPLGEVASRHPVHVLRARTASTVPQHAVARLARTGARTAEAEGSHMLPAERPAAVAAFLDMTLAGEGV